MNDSSGKFFGMVLIATGLLLLGVVALTYLSIFPHLESMATMSHWQDSVGVVTFGDIILTIVAVAFSSVGVVVYVRSRSQWGMQT